MEKFVPKYIFLIREKERVGIFGITHTDMENQFDLIIVGGGPIGLACALEAAKAGLSYCILEKGCLVNSLYHYPSNMTFFSTSEKIEIEGHSLRFQQCKAHQA